ncbi:GNAT family N-acetyltransferase [Clostridium sp. CS001]|uniref:GNAT family N-acetyltransferase n=1 Tax=Clostridium sp. CS001 TaxID=2880648 RepID=UPI001CF2D944|nr:GNAT family N-acetyltransferase [Clostridium sp. CS001]MCB2291536.1 GNAT family N-acetyltransferase [Clostridium sp. CS001]
MEKLIIRECTLEDLDYVQSLQHQWVEEDITYGLVSVDRNYLEIKLSKYFFVAELNVEIIGFVFGTIHEAKDMAILDNGQLYIEVEDIYISSNSRGTGIGSLLLDKILEVAKDNVVT